MIFDFKNHEKMNSMKSPDPEIEFLTKSIMAARGSREKDIFFHEF